MIERRIRSLSGLLLVAALLGVSAATAAQAPAAAASEEAFSVTEYRVLGNTVLQARTIEAALYGELGAGKTLADVERVRQQLERVYRDSGYGTVYVDIPEQSVDAGIVRLKVTEGRLDRVRMTGARYFSQGRIRERLPALESGQVLNLPVLQAQLAKVNQDSRDRSVTPVLKAGRAPGTVDVELKVTDGLPLHASVEVNDRYTANTTETRASVNIGYENLFQRYHALSLQYQTTPEAPDETRVLAATYLAPLAASGNMIAVYAVDTNSDFAVVNTSGDLSVLGAGRIYGARYIFRLPGIGKYFHSLTLGGDFKDFADNIRLADGATDTTPIKYMTWSAAYGGNYATAGTSTGFNIALNAGMNGLVNEQSDFDYKRYNAQANFMYLRADAFHERPLPGGLSLYSRVAGQWSGDPLISNEQLSIGGAATVRGYIESTQLGDLGLVGGVELRSPSLHRWFGEFGQRFVFFGFYDAGMVSILDWIESIESAPDVNGNTTFTNVVRGSKRYSLSSAGAGVRFAGLGGLDAALDWAYPLRPAAETLRGDSRIHFQVRYGF